ncbi:PP2C family protein-serine/threonine phosphatase [Modicisalibacter sp. 'Wilcox']|uniref:PP2C family protein-serine/threonine phosphatase n=1 Tax=Modicisalibacter sp. 'Wilcox' TaxID=2679914 RepID=UPI0013D6B820|nr:PP2C family protein-serine/threonine phosphatase [Modicisalibacter sp. 'Wilcox']
MDKPRTLIGLLDLPGDDRDALAEALGKGHLAVAAAERLEDLPESVELVVAHVRAVPSRQWTALARRHPTVVVTESRLDDELLHAVDSGLVDYLVEPLRHGDVLRRLVARAVEHQRLAEAHARDRARLVELNENLETHLAMLRLDQQAGGHVQRKMLPPTPLVLNGVRCDYWLEPSLYLSGDFLDFLRFDARYSAFYFADVSGHGASSAFVTVLLKYLCNRWLQEWHGESPEALPASWLARLNHELLDTGIGKHVTLFVGVLDRTERCLHYSLGAQLPMPLLKDDDGITVLEGEGMPVGLFPGLAYPTYRLDLPANFRLWLCSDGVLECLPGETLSARLDELKRRVAASDDIEGLRAGLNVARDDTDVDHQEELPDDLTIMTLSGFDHDKQ